MILMAMLTLATWSAVGLFIHFRKPVVMEKIIDKLVPCPEQEAPEVQPIKPAKPIKGKGPIDFIIEKGAISPSQKPPQAVINAPQGIGIAGGNVTNPTVNNFAVPNRHLGALGT